MAWTWIWKPAWSSARASASKASGSRSGVPRSPGQVDVGFEEGRRVRLDDPVGEDLGRGRLEARPGVATAERGQAPDLGNAAAGVHLERGQNPDAELAGAVEGRVGLQDVPVGPGLDDRYDAEAVGHGQSRFQSVDIFHGPEGGDTRLDEAGRALPQGPRRFACPWVALDAAADGVRRVPGDAGQGQGPRIDPAAVAVGGIQNRGPVGDEGVEIFLARIRLREKGQGPAAARDPGEIGVRGRVLPDPGEHRFLRRELGDIAGEQLDAAHDEVDVGILEGRQDHAAAEIDDPGRAAPPHLGPCGCRRRRRSFRPRRPGLRPGAAWPTWSSQPRWSG